MEEAGVQIEDKRYSISLHYRLAPNRALAESRILAALPPDSSTVSVIRGKCVVNLTPAGAPDKADALLRIVAQVGAGSVLFVGDDLSDDPVFAKAPADWMTVRVGRDHTLSMNRFYVDSPSQLAPLLQVAIDFDAAA